MTNEKNYMLSWGEYDKLCYQLAEKITNDNTAFNNIICIARGGLVIGRILADILDLPLHVIYTQRYKKGSKETYSVIRLTDVLSTSKFGGNILVVDDITDEGITMKTVVEKIKSMVDINTVKSATLFHKPRSVFTPDYYIKTTNDWIVFPYEVCEYCLDSGQEKCPKGVTEKGVCHRNKKKPEKWMNLH
ncbi:MAG: phosphoribosyltransferase family protein [Candidatus Thermoplasmatota archaeon]|nr:phosphoribosyltransferase family protein [Candidatus Thermoplasmatota archaeon]